MHIILLIVILVLLYSSYYNVNNVNITNVFPKVLPYFALFSSLSFCAAPSRPPSARRSLRLPSVLYLTTDLQLLRVIFCLDGKSEARVADTIFTSLVAVAAVSDRFIQQTVNICRSTGYQP